MVARITCIYWSKPPVSGVLIGASTQHPALCVTDNTVHRTAQHWGSMVEALRALALVQLPASIRLQLVEGVSVARNVTAMPSLHRALLEWGAGLKLEAGSAPVTEGSSAITPAAVTTAPTGIAAVPTVSYDGIKGLARSSSAHSAQAIHEIVCEAVAKCIAAWGWVPTGLSVQFHRGRKAMGLAFAPGVGNRRISLAMELLTKYDRASILRVVLHELAHHAREELYPRNRSRYTDSHDAKFCEVLGKVDPEVLVNKTMCTYFLDEVDEQVVAQVAAASGIIYSSTAGVFILGHEPDGRRLRWKWEATGTHRWRSSWQRLQLETFLAFIRQFPVADRSLLSVSYEPHKYATMRSLYPAGFDFNQKPVPPVTSKGQSAWLIKKIAEMFRPDHAAQILEALKQ